MFMDSSLLFYPAQSSVTTPTTTNGYFSSTTTGNYPSLAIVNPLLTAGTPQGTLSPLTPGMAYSPVTGLQGTTTTGSTLRGQGEDLGIANGVVVPKLALVVAVAFSSGSGTDYINWQLQCSPDNVNWYNIGETGSSFQYSSTGSTSYTGNLYFGGSTSKPALTVGSYILPIDVPRRPAGVPFPNYYRMNAIVSSSGGVTGTVTGGIVLSRDDARDSVNTYNSNFAVV